MRSPKAGLPCPRRTLQTDLDLDRCDRLGTVALQDASGFLASGFHDAGQVGGLAVLVEGRRNGEVQRGGVAVAVFEFDLGAGVRGGDDGLVVLDRHGTGRRLLVTLGLGAGLDTAGIEGDLVAVLGLLAVGAEAGEAAAGDQAANRLADLSDDGTLFRAHALFGDHADAGEVIRGEHGIDDGLIRQIGALLDSGLDLLRQVVAEVLDQDLVHLASQAHRVDASVDERLGVEEGFEIGGEGDLDFHVGGETSGLIRGDLTGELLREGGQTFEFHSTLSVSVKGATSPLSLVVGRMPRMGGDTGLPFVTMWTIIHGRGRLSSASTGEFRPHVA